MFSEFSTSQNFPQSLVGLQHTDHPIHQLLSRIFAIFSREYLNFRNIYLIPLNFTADMSSNFYELDKLTDALNLIQ